MSAIPRPAFFARLWTRYTTALRERPLRTKMIQSGVLYVAADLTAQPIRTARLTLYGSTVFAPLAHIWLGKMEQIRLTSKLLTLGVRMTLDSLLWSPFVCAMFPTVLGLLEGKDLRQVRQKLEMGWFPTWQKAVCVFGPAQLINFTIIPPPHRLMAIQSVGLCWNIFLSWQNNQNNQLLAAASARLAEAQAHAQVAQASGGGAGAGVGEEEEREMAAVKQAERDVQKAQERKEKMRKEGGEDGVGVRMSWS